ncbi:unknown [Fusobacterium sp. CAG:439]|mgnify:FL=1|nr:unknown [Fusobacterium sp. CAG:439]
MNYYVGLSLAASSGMDSGIAVLDENDTLILVDKLYTMNDVMFFFDNFPSLKYSKICVSLVWDRTMLNGKWRILGKPYQMVATNPLIPNREGWTQRYSTRGCEYFKSLMEKGVEINRFELYLTRQSMHLNSCYKERSPADCKFLQQTLKNEWHIDLPLNMMPMSQLEAIVGAILAKENTKNPDNIKVLSHFRDANVIDVINNPKLLAV